MNGCMYVFFTFNPSVMIMWSEFNLYIHVNSFTLYSVYSWKKVHTTFHVNNNLSKLYKVKFAKKGGRS